MLFVAVLFSMAFAGQPSVVGFSSTLADEISKLAPPVRAAITSISPDGIMIDAGREDGVLPGMVFEVFHQARFGNEVDSNGSHPMSPIGEIRALRISEERTLAEAQGLLLGMKNGDLAVSRPRWCGIEILVEEPMPRKTIELIEKSLSERLYSLGLMDSPESLGYRPGRCLSKLYLFVETLDHDRIVIAASSGEYHIGDIDVDLGVERFTDDCLPVALDTLATCIITLEDEVISAAGLHDPSGDRVLCVTRERVLLLAPQGDCLGVDAHAQLPSPSFAYQRDPAAVILPAEDGTEATLLLSSEARQLKIRIRPDGGLGISEGSGLHGLDTVPGRNYFELTDAGGRVWQVLNVARKSLGSDDGSEQVVVTRERKLKLLKSGGTEEVFGSFGYAFCSGDLDGDGDPEIVTTSDSPPGEPDFVKVLKRSSSGWASPWESPSIGASISAVASADLGSDGIEELLIFLDRGDSTRLVVVSGKDVTR
jgi:hypothetical protein